jgi:hypothetical protein
MSNVSQRMLQALLPVLFVGCYHSAGRESDFDTAEYHDSTEPADVDMHESAPDAEDMDGEDASAACDFGPLMDPVQLTFHSRYPYKASSPAMVFTGSEFAIVWLDSSDTLGEGRDLFFTTLSPSGKKIVDDRMQWEREPWRSPTHVSRAARPGWFLRSPHLRVDPATS